MKTFQINLCQCVEILAPHASVVNISIKLTHYSYVCSNKWLISATVSKLDMENQIWLSASMLKN